MTNRTGADLLLLVPALALVLAGCNGDSSTITPTAPSQQTVRPPALLPAVLYGVSLFGVVFEMTPTGQMPVADVSIYCDACGESGHTWLRTDANGYDSFSGDLNSGGGIWLSAGPTLILVAREGFLDPPGQTPGQRQVQIEGDTRFNVELVRR